MWHIRSSSDGCTLDRERERAEQALAMVHLDGLADRHIQLSGGQQQRVALARALVHEPDVMLLDEPLSNLDAKLREDMRFEIKELQSRTGLTIVYVTHDQGEAMAMSDCVVVMDQGRVMQIGSPMEVYEQPADQWVAGFIGLTNLLPCRVSESEDGVRGVRLGDAGNVFVPCKTPPGETGNGLLSVRPENIVISLLGAGAGIRAVVERATYMGHVTDYLVRVETLSLRAQIMGRVRLKTGDDVRVLLEDPIFSGAAPCHAHADAMIPSSDAAGFHPSCWASSDVPQDCSVARLRWSSTWAPNDSPAQRSGPRRTPLRCPGCKPARQPGCRRSRAARCALARSDTCT